MAYTIRGRRQAFDNISVGNATGRERTITGVTPGTVSDVSGYGERLRTSEGTSYGSLMGAEFTARTVSGNQVSDRTTDLGH